MHSKRGISPLIASVLLIAFVVTLFLIISSFVQRSVVEPGLQEGGEKIGKTLDCLSVTVSVVEACVQSDNAQVRVKVDNDGDVELHGVTLRVIGDDDVQTVDIDRASDPVPPLGRVDSGEQSVSVGTITDIEVIPEIESGLCRSNLVSKTPVVKTDCA